MRLNEQLIHKALRTVPGTGCAANSCFCLADWDVNC